MNYEEFMSESPEVRAKMQKQTDKIRSDFKKSGVGTALMAGAQLMRKKAPTAIFTDAQPTADGTLDAARKRGLMK